MRSCGALTTFLDFLESISDSRIRGFVTRGRKLGNLVLHAPPKPNRGAIIRYPDVDRIKKHAA